MTSLVFDSIQTQIYKENNLEYVNWNVQRRSDSNVLIKITQKININDVIIKKL